MPRRYDAAACLGAKPSADREVASDIAPPISIEVEQIIASVAVGFVLGDERKRFAVGIFYHGHRIERVCPATVTSETEPSACFDMWGLQQIAAAFQREAWY